MRERAVPFMTYYYGYWVFFFLFKFSSIHLIAYGTEAYLHWLLHAVRCGFRYILFFSYNCVSSGCVDYDSAIRTESLPTRRGASTKLIGPYSRVWVFVLWWAAAAVVVYCASPLVNVVRWFIKTNYTRVWMEHRQRSTEHNRLQFDTYFVAVAAAVRRLSLYSNGNDWLTTRPPVVSGQKLQTSRKQSWFH